MPTAQQTDFTKPCSRHKGAKVSKAQRKSILTGRIGRGQGYLVPLALLVIVIAAMLAPIASAATRSQLAEINSFGLKPRGVATDSAGNVYASNGSFEGNGSIKIYSSAGSQITEFAPTGNVDPLSPSSLAVDAGGNVYVTSATAAGSGDVVKYKPSEFPPTAGTIYTADTAINSNGKLVSSRATAVAVDPSNQNVFVATTGVNETQTFKWVDFAECFSASEDEEWTITFRGATTAPLKCDAETTSSEKPSSEEIETALNALSTIGGVGGSVSVESFETKIVQFKGELGKTNIEPEALEVKTFPSGDLIRKSNPSVEGVLSSISKFQSDGTLLSGTIGAGLVAGASFYGVDVYGANGNVYVTDVVHGKAHILNPAGSSILTTISGPPGGFGALTTAALAVDQSNGNVLVSDIRTNARVAEFNASGQFVTTLSPFEEATPSDIAVSADGKAYVTSGSFFGPILVYSALEPKKTVSTAVSPPGNGEVNCNGDPCAAEYAEGSSISFEAVDSSPGSGEEFKEWVGGTGSAASCNGSTNPVCVVTLNEDSSITAEFGLSGAELTVTKDGPGTGTVTSQPSGINCDPDCDELFSVDEVVKLTAAPDAGSALKEWIGCDAIVETDKCEVTLSSSKAVTATFGTKPSVVTGGATGTTKSTTTLNGTVDPNEFNVTSCEFQYGTSLAYGQTAPCVPSPGDGDSPVAVSAAVSSLEADEDYHFRLVATNGVGTDEGADATFSTPAFTEPAVTTTAGATEVTQTSAKVAGTINPNGVAVTSCEVEYGTSLPSATKAACVPTPGSGSSPVAVSAELENLSADTTYKFRFIANNAEPAEGKGSEQEFKTLSNAPTVTNDPEGTLTQTTAVLNGKVDANGADTTACNFQVTTAGDTGFSNPGVKTFACSPATILGSAGNTAVIATATGLTANTAYIYRVVAINPGGTTNGAPAEGFSTLPSAPTVTNANPGTVTQSSIVLKGTVDNNGASGGSACKFVLATEAAPGTAIAEPDCSPATVTGTGSTNVEATVSSGLSANTKYVYRVVATNTGGTSTGTPDKAVQTLPNAPTVTTTAGATSIAQTSATVAGTVNPNGGNVTSCKVKYGTTTGYGFETDCASLPGSGTSSVGVSKGLTGLSPNTTYHFKVVATNAGGTGEGLDREFKTLPVPPAVTSTPGATGITQKSAIVAGTVDPNGSEVSSCEVEYGTTVSYGQSAPCSPDDLGTGTSPVAVTASLSGLAADTTYHFRVVATNPGGTANGPDRTFTTLANTCETDASLCPPSSGGGGTTPPPPVPPSNRAKPGVAKQQGQAVALKVTVPGAGTLVATGKKMVKSTKAAKAAGVVTLKLKLTNAGKKQLKKKGKVEVKVKVVFTPTGGTPGTSTKTVTFKKGKK